MRYAQPPDRDPELRHALALDVDEQNALLLAMAGQPVGAGNAASAASFEHIGVVTRRHSHSFVCLPPPLGDVALAGDAPILKIRIGQDVLDRRSMPRRPDAVAELEALIAAHNAQLGVWSLPWTPPNKWTIADLLATFSEMWSRLPSAAGQPRNFAGLRIHKAWETHLEVDIPYGRDPARFFAKVVLQSDAAAQLNLVASWSGTFERLEDEVRRKAVAPAPAPALHEPAEADADDDDLDAFERIARRTLHGDRSGETRDRNLDDLTAKLRRLGRTRPHAIPGVRHLIEGLLRDAR